MLLQVKERSEGKTVEDEVEEEMNGKGEGVGGVRRKERREGESVERTAVNGTAYPPNSCAVVLASEPENVTESGDRVSKAVMKAKWGR